MLGVGLLIDNQRGLLHSERGAAATQFAVQGALQKWLSNYIKVQAVTVTAREMVLTVTVTYALLNTGVTQVQTFVYGGPQ